MREIKHLNDFSVKRIWEWGLTLLVTAVVLIAVDLWVEKSFGGPPPFESFYRFSGELKAGEFDRQIKSIEGEPGFRVAFLGDSVVRGTSVAESSQTIPAYLQKEINSDPDLRAKGVKVFNFGIAGARDADKYGVLKTLLDKNAVDLVVMNVSYPFYSEEILQIPVQFPHIYYNAFSPQEKEELGIADLEAPAGTEIGQGTAGEAGQPADPTPDQVVADSGLERAVTERVLSAWKVYRYRNELNQYLFGGHPVKTGQKALERLLGKKLAGPEVELGPPDVAGVALDMNNLAAKDRPENMYKPYDQFEWEEREVEHLRKVYNVGPLDENNVGYRYLKKTLDLAQERDVPVVLFFTPINTQLLDRFQVLDRDDWQSGAGQLQQLFSSRGIECHDLQNSVEARFFHDSLHLVDEGNEQVARALYQRIKPDLTREVVR